MDQRFKEIIAATDMIIADWERLRPPLCTDAVELNWRLRKLHIARQLLSDVAEKAGQQPTLAHAIGRSAHSFALYRTRAE